MKFIRAMVVSSFFFMNLATIASNNQDPKMVIHLNNNNSGATATSHGTPGTIVGFFDRVSGTFERSRSFVRSGIRVTKIGAALYVGAISINKFLNTTQDFTKFPPIDDFFNDYTDPIYKMKTTLENTAESLGITQTFASLNEKRKQNLEKRSLTDAHAQNSILNNATHDFRNNYDLPHVEHHQEESEKTALQKLDESSKQN